MTSLLKKDLIRLMALVAVSAWTLSSCSDSQEGGNAYLKVRLTDAPANYEAVLIDVREVRVKVNEAENSDDERGWLVLQNINPGIYNLLELTNGLDTLIGEGEIPAGRLQQIRLILGDQNTIVQNGQSSPLRTPSAQQSGLKINVHETLEAGLTYTILLDFDAARSIVSAGNSGNILLKPVIRASLEANTGSIRGNVVPAEVNAVAYAIAGSDTVTSAFTNSDGFFLLRALPPNTYTVSIVPAEGFASKLFDGISVGTGQSVSLGEISVTD